MEKLPVPYRLIRKTSRPLRFLFVIIDRFYKIRKKLGLARTYNTWASENEELCFTDTHKLTKEPLVSVVVPAYNTVQAHLLGMLYSVINQHYENWELVIVNASDDKARKDAVADCANIDKRIKVVDPGENLGISGNTNFGIEYARGEFIAFLDHDDLLHPCALHSLVERLGTTGADLLYSDEDKIDHSGGRYFDPHFKPDWSPDLLRNVNYINHLTIISTKFIKRVRGLRAEFDGAQDYDLLLRVIDGCNPRIEHVPRVLYHWRAAETSTAQNIANKGYIFKAGTTAIKEHLKRNKVLGKVKALEGKPGFYKIVYPRPNTINIVVGPVNYELRARSAQWIEELLKKQDRKKIRVFVGDWYKNYAGKEADFEGISMINEDSNYWDNVAAAIRDDVVICFQQAVLPLDKHALDELGGIANQDNVLTVCPIISSETGTIIDAGLVNADFGLERLFQGYDLGDGTFFGSTEWVRDIDAPTCNVFATKATHLKEMVLNMPRNQGILTSTEARTLQKTNTTGRHVLWGHLSFEYVGALRIDIRGTYFNPQLAHAHADINVKVSSWRDFDGRTES